MLSWYVNNVKTTSTDKFLNYSCYLWTPKVGIHIISPASP